MELKIILSILHCDILCALIAPIFLDNDEDLPYWKRVILVFATTIGIEGAFYLLIIFPINFISNL